PSALGCRFVCPLEENGKASARTRPRATGMAIGRAKRENRLRRPRPRPALPGPVSIEFTSRSALLAFGGMLDPAGVHNGSISITQRDLFGARSDATTRIWPR